MVGAKSHLSVGGSETLCLYRFFLGNLGVWGEGGGKKSHIPKGTKRVLVHGVQPT